MKRFLLACCLGAVIITAQAQPGQPDSAKRLEFMQKSLQLTDVQVKKVKPIFDSADEQRHALEDKYKISEMKQFHADMKQLHEQTRTQLAAVLTPSQLQALDTLHKGREHMMHRGHGPHPDGQAPDSQASAH